MAEYSQILAAIDLSESAEAVMARASALARTYGAQLSGLHVVTHLRAQHARAAHVSDIVEMESQGLTGAQAQRLLGLMQGSGARQLLAAGRPSRVVRETATAMGADLVVMGSHTPHGVAGLLGSTSERVAHGLECDALVIRYRPDKPSADPPAPYRRVLCAADLAKDCPEVIARARAWSRPDAAELIVLYVEEHFPPDRSNELIPSEQLDPETHLRERAHASLGNLAGEACLEGARAELVVSERSAKHEIVHFAATREVDLIVIGSHGYQGRAAWLGTTADGVLHRAPCDVLLVRVAG